MNCRKLELVDEERSKIKTLVSSLKEGFKSFDDTEFLKHLPLSAYLQPNRLVRFLNDFKYDPPVEGFCIISSGMIEEQKLEPTPSHWELDTNTNTCLDVVMAMCLSATVLGDIYGWFTQQDGCVVHDILPIKSHESEQLGCGSIEDLAWHTEDAFHPLRGDYLMMMCLRNNDRVPTIIGKPDYSRLSEDDKNILFEKNFQIKPDNSHKLENCSSKRMQTIKSGNVNTKDIDSAFNSINMRDENPEKIAVLFGDKKNPFLRIDPYFMETPECKKSEIALNKLIKIIDDSLYDIVLSPGEIVVIDNFRVVHGRRSFKPKYDGNDRWYKRINIIRDIRKCQNRLENQVSRVVC